VGTEEHVHVLYRSRRWSVFCSCCMPRKLLELTCRFRQASHLLYILYCHSAQLWNPPPYPTRCLDDFPIIYIPMFRSYSIQASNQGYGRSVSRCYRGRCRTFG
jgi:hypothetical protein